MTGYPKIKAVAPLSGRRLRVVFATGETKVYDCTPLLTEAPFRLLKDEAFFRNVYADRTGYGVAWNDNIDLSEAELWLHGVEE
jgi:hypothetical protein